MTRIKDLTFVAALHEFTQSQLNLLFGPQIEISKLLGVGSYFIHSDRILSLTLKSRDNSDTDALPEFFSKSM